LIALVVVVLLLALACALWLRSRRRGGVIAAPTGDRKPSQPGGDS